MLHLMNVAYQESGMTTSRLAILIDSLAAGADVFAPSSHPGTSEDVNEMELVLDGQEAT